ncbi:MAG: O-antigen ligase family protein [Synergistaceae bacterium]|jgi:O-antigen ligase|nr:O-antigen ligase family protein [Synergistaceae bacterium]
MSLKKGKDAENTGPRDACPPPIPGKELLPERLYRAAFFFSLVLPNLIYSGIGWFDTLHIMKWAAAMIPAAVMTIAAGVRLFRFGANRTGFVLDAFSAGWLAVILLITAQPAFIKLTSGATFVKEWFFFAALWAVYTLACSVRPRDRFFRAILWGSSVNAAINVLFAELLIRDMNKGIPFIMDVPGNYIGNTGQQEMFGLWMAIAVFNCIFLHTRYSGGWKKGVKSRFLISANLFLLAVCSCGLWRSTARGAILSLAVAVFILLICMFRNREYRAVINISALFGIVLVFMVLVITLSPTSGTNRGGALADKMLDMVKNPGTFGGRIAIWRISREIFLKEPVTGVGLGHYKWHFLDGQRIFFSKYPELAGTAGYDWQYTYWAHSEYLQWLCETGIIGAAMLGLLALWWLYSFVMMLVRRKNFPPEALWGCALIFLLWFDALFSRPFHRIENAVWMSFAFALANRTILPGGARWAKRENDLAYRTFGGFIAAVSLLGLIFLGGGMIGDQLILRAWRSPSIEEKEALLSMAESFPMARDDALDMKAYIHFSYGMRNKDPDRYTSGADELYRAFAARPNSERLYRLYDISRELNDVDTLRKIIPYLPGRSGYLR